MNSRPSANAQPTRYRVIGVLGVLLLLVLAAQAWFDASPVPQDMAGTGKASSSAPASATAPARIEQVGQQAAK